MSDTTNTNAESKFIIRTFPVGPLGCNCSVIGDRLSGRALVIDPGGNAEQIMALLKELNLQVVAIIHTHAHLDHILAAGEIKKATGAPIYLHEGDQFLWERSFSSWVSIQKENTRWVSTSRPAGASRRTSAPK